MGRIALLPDDLTACRFCGAEEAHRLLSRPLAARLTEALSAAAQTDTVYMEEGKVWAHPA